MIYCSLSLSLQGDGKESQLYPCLVHVSNWKKAFRNWGYTVCLIYCERICIHVHRRYVQRGERVAFLTPWLGRFNINYHRDETTFLIFLLKLIIQSLHYKKTDNCVGCKSFVFVIYAIIITVGSNINTFLQAFMLRK